MLTLAVSSDESSVPKGRFERLARLGVAATGVAAGSVGARLRRFTKNETQETAQLLLSKGAAVKLAKRLSRLRGGAMKLGQMLSMEGDDFLPPDVAEALSVLRSSADAMPEHEVREVLIRQYGERWEEKFSSFDFVPIASASIGQVHHAISNDGERLALKIQYPGVADSIASDVDNLASMIKLARLLPVEIESRGIVEETKKQLQEEADYIREADELERFYDFLKDDDRFKIPKLKRSLTTPEILAMEYVEGRPIDTLWSGDIDLELNHWVAESLIDLVFREFAEFSYMQTDPNFANYLICRNPKKIILLDFGAARPIRPIFAKGFLALGQAAASGHEHEIENILETMGYFEASDPPERRDALAQIVKLATEPLGFKGAYDFANSTLSPRARELGFELAVKKRLLVRPPPPETLFIQRKLGGLYLLLQKLGVQVDVRQRLETLLDNFPLNADI